MIDATPDPVRGRRHEMDHLVTQAAPYKVIRNAVSDDVMSLVKRYFNLQLLTAGYLQVDHRERRLERYGDVLGESLLLQLKPLFEAHTGLRLFSSYSFFRAYRRGASLKAHVDRPACEISGTLVVDYVSGSLWPIYVRRDREAVAVHLDRGDLLIYRGCEVPHWREEFHGERWLQLFLHYVDADGPYRQHKFDGRPIVGFAGRPDN